MIGSNIPAGSGVVAELMLRYKRWANALTFEALAGLPEVELLRTRPTNFKNILSTLNHVRVVDDIFRAHLEGREHGYTSRNEPDVPSLHELQDRATALDDWFVDYCSSLTPVGMVEPVAFRLIGGGHGVMTREQIFLHVVNHGSYHRGFVSDMMYQIPAVPPANDLSVYLRDHP